MTVVFGHFMANVPTCVHQCSSSEVFVYRYKSVVYMLLCTSDLCTVCVHIIVYVISGYSYAMPQTRRNTSATASTTTTPESWSATQSWSHFRRRVRVQLTHWGRQKVQNYFTYSKVCPFIRHAEKLRERRGRDSFRKRSK